jgi:PncC family amidohydrolase
MPHKNNLLRKASILQELCIKHNIKLSLAESCTGGMLSSIITSIPGSSKYFSYSLVTYSNEAKIKLLNIQSDIIHKFGAVSSECALAMSRGALNIMHNDLPSITLSITGIAGPGGAINDKKVGLVYIAIAYNEKLRNLMPVPSNKNFVVKNYNFTGDREEIRISSCNAALDHLIESLSTDL